MKLELPISIVLLAAGGLLWAGQSKWLNFSLRRSGNSQSVEASNDRARTNPGLLLSTAVPLTDAESSTANSQSAAFLQSVGANLRLAPPFQTELQVQIQWSERSYSIGGIYAQPGQGSGQSKMELRVGTGADATTMTKICDGRFLYSFQQRGTIKTLEFIDLRRLQETRLSAGLAQSDNPLSWIATGGLASLLENLAVAFNLGPAIVSEVNGIVLCTIEGDWRIQSLAELLGASIGSESEGQIFLENLPPQIPSRIKIELANVPAFGWLPQKLTFFRPEKNSSPTLMRVLADVQFSAPASFVFDPDEFLHINTDEVESTDVTDLYVEQVHDFGFARQASQGSGDATMLR